MHKGGGYVFNTVHNILPDVPPENIVAMFYAAQVFKGYYKIKKQANTIFCEQLPGSVVTIHTKNLIAKIVRKVKIQ